MIILSIVCVKNTVENVNFIILQMADKPYLVKIVLIMHNKCSLTDIAHNSANHSHAEQRTRTNYCIQTNRWLTRKQFVLRESCDVAHTAW